MAGQHSAWRRTGGAAPDPVLAVVSAEGCSGQSAHMSLGGRQESLYAGPQPCGAVGRLRLGGASSAERGGPGKDVLGLGP
ncbi:hypothetical protein AB0O07_22310 [Streptomyces sp. NPDC093085]|uniref:hypothetical protein n=1 Tax=Streptomyces sp. NPDC093085 TaxID=3155068 RepID=UPI003433C2DE